MIDHEGLKSQCPLVIARDRFRLRLAEHGDVDLAVLVVGRTGQWFHRR